MSNRYVTCLLIYRFHVQIVLNIVQANRIYYNIHNLYTISANYFNGFYKKPYIIII